MVFCLNPSCTNPDNPDTHKYCQGCGAVLADSTQEYLFRSRFQVIKKLGQGGFGRTYLAKDLDCRDRLCVIKKLLIQGNDVLIQRVKELFDREGEQLDKLQHSQIPKLIAYFAYQDGLYLVQEYIQGKNLYEEYQQQGRFSEEKIKELLLSILPVLQYIHSQQIIHRDIKPENIMRRDDGSLVLIDFGATKVVSETVPSQSVLIPSSPGYSPLEQQQGNAKAASDIYSLGATAIRLLTGCFVDDSNQDSLFDDYHNQWIWREYLEKSNLKINPQLEAILNKMVAVSLANRYQDVADILADFNNLSQAFNNSQINTQVVNIAPVSTSSPLIFNKKMLMLGVGIIFLTIGSLLFFFTRENPNQSEITTLAFPAEVNTFEDEELVVIIRKDSPSNYSYESRNKKTNQFLNLKESSCQNRQSEQDLECIWSNEGIKYQVLYNPNNPSEIRLLIYGSWGEDSNERTLKLSNTKPLW
ncbi:MAG: serine/threonine protein kinase [Gloeocapsa sp. DLM2.Bin57]|nr:MAG: serine/threonine protein kinase [Gloeocapsa sp. DLM2.Bin57]